MTEYLLKLKPVPHFGGIPPEQRLRAALKRLLRDYGLRAVELKPEAPAKKAGEG